MYVYVCKNKMRKIQTKILNKYIYIYVYIFILMFNKTKYNLTYTIYVS